MSLELDAKTTALMVIDLEPGILASDPKPHKAADVVERSVALADGLRKAGGAVVWVHVLLNEIVQQPVDKPQTMPPVIPPEASELVPEVTRQETDKVVAKRQWGAFTGTDLDQYLRRKGVKTVIMAGVATNLGVESTARAASELGYALVFAEDAMSSRTKDMHEFAVETMFPLMGRVRSTKEILTVIG